MNTRRQKNTDELDPTPFVVRLKTHTIDEIKRRAERDRRPPSQWLRNLIEDALLNNNKKVVVK